MSFEKLKNPVNETCEVFCEATKNKRDQIIQKRKKYLKYTISSSFGLAVSFISDNLIEALLLLGLFSAHILLSE